MIAAPGWRMEAMRDKLTVRDLSDQQLRGKRVLLRVDFNVPLDEEGRVVDDSRIRATLPTLEYLRGRGAGIVIMSHLGRPKGAPEPGLSLRPVAEELGKLLGREVTFCPDPASDDAVAASERLEPGDVLVIENTRFNPGEAENDPEFAEALSHLGDVYVNDAFGTAHRAHASTAGVARYIEPAAAGLLMERELDYLGHLLDNPERPFVTLLGGAKVSSKIEFIKNLLGKVDRLAVGGAMACTFIKAMGFSVGRSLVEDDYTEFASGLMDEAGDVLLLPVDVVVTDELEREAAWKRVELDAIPDDALVADIGPRSAEAFAEQVRTARTILWNGPLGVFEVPPFDEGTRMIATAVAAATEAGATSVVGGGDTAAAVAAFGLSQEMTHISTGGGASLELLAGKELPGVAALTDRPS